MKLLRSALICMACLTMGRAEIEFMGVLVSSNATKLNLVDTTNKTSRWVAPGENFAGYLVVAYDSKGDCAVLTKDGEQIRVSLRKAAKVEGTQKMDIIEYVLKPGDTFVKVARAFEVPIQQLVDLNPEVDPTRLKVGQKIRVK